MRNFARKIIGLFLMLALVVMPARIAFADNHHPADPNYAPYVSGASQSHEVIPPSSPQAHHAAQGSTSAAGAEAANHLAMPDIPSDAHCDTPANTTCDKSHASNTTHHCSSDAHCCVALIESLYDATHVAPYTPRSTLSITLTSIIIPTATKPPRNNFSA